MTSTAMALRRFRLIPPNAGVNELIVGLVVALGVAAGVMAGEKATARYVIGGAGAVILFVIATRGRSTAVKLVLGGLVFLGLARRLLIPFAGWSAQDPLLLVGPAAALVIWINGRKESPKRIDALTLMAVFFLLWIFGQLLNPISPLAVNALGLIFWLPAIVWFFVGRTLHLSDHKHVVHIVTLLSIIVAAHGLYHTYVGLFSFEYTWLEHSGFGAAIFVNGFNIRPFASLVSPQEYGQFLAIVVGFLWSAILMEEKHRGLRLALFAYLGWALFMQGSRSIFGLTVIMIVITGMLKAKGPMKLAVGMIVVSFIWFLASVQPPEHEEGAELSQSLITHQLSGLLDPGGEEGTGPLHIKLIQEGFRSSLENPLGSGLGSTSIAVSKVDPEKQTTSSEADISDVFETFGVVPGLAYLWFIMVLFGIAGRRWSRNKSAYSMGVLAMLIVTFGHIYAGGLYMVVSFVWFTIGGMTRDAEEDVAEAASEDRAAAPFERELEPAA